MPLALPSFSRRTSAIVGYGYASVLLRALVCALVLHAADDADGRDAAGDFALAGDRPRGALRTSGCLYMANIAGGAVGTVLAGFYLLRVYDTVIAGGVAVAINLVVAARWPGALARRAMPYQPVERQARRLGLPSRRADASRVRLHPAPIYLVAALSGLTALGAEVVWTRQLSLLFGASVYTFSLILAVFLAGLGLGSFAGSVIARRRGIRSCALGLRARCCSPRRLASAPG